MMTKKTVHIEERIIPAYRLGRHIEHDPLSKNFPAVLPGVPVIASVEHIRHTNPFNQGFLGSCTGNAAAGVLDTDPLFIKRKFYERDAINIYKLATALDEFPGRYPPTDTGSSGLGAAKACRKLGFITSYRWAFGLTQALQALQLAPVMTGVYWHEGFDRPDPISGLVKLGGEVRGGHEFMIRGFMMAHTNDPILDGIVHAVNSWGLGWGKRGHFFFSARDWATLLEQEGDVTVLIK